MTTKAFPTADVLSATTGHLVSEGGIGAIYEVLNWMTGESLFTHQLPRVIREAAPVVLKLHPELAAAYEEAKQVNRENWREWLAKWTARYGQTITVPKLTISEHERIDALSEFAEKVSPPIIRDRSSYDALLKKAASEAAP